MRVIITGAAGYVGSALARFLIKRNCEVLLLDNYYLPSNLTDIDGVKITRADIRDEDLDLSSYDAMIHLAGIAGIKICEENQEEAYSVNVKGTFNLSCLFKGRIVFASTSAIYGQAAEPVITEKTPVTPRSYYGETKHKAEGLLRVRGNWCNLRFSNIYGKGLLCKRTVADLFIENVLKGSPIVIHGDGKQRRNFVHINDVVKAYWRALNSELQGEFNIGGEEDLSINEIAQLVCDNHRELIGTMPEITRIPIDCGVVWREFKYSSDKAKKQLLYDPTYTVNDEIRQRLRTHARYNSKGVCS